MAGSEGAGSAGATRSQQPPPLPWRPRRQRPVAFHVTGFGVFNGIPDNPTTHLVQELPGELEARRRRLLAARGQSLPAAPAAKPTVGAGAAGEGATGAGAAAVGGEAQAAATVTGTVETTPRVVVGEAGGGGAVVGGVGGGVGLPAYGEGFEVRSCLVLDVSAEEGGRQLREVHANAGRDDNCARDNGVESKGGGESGGENGGGGGAPAEIGAKGEANGEVKAEAISKARAEPQAGAEAEAGTWTAARARDDTVSVFVHCGVNGGATKFAMETQGFNEATFGAPDERGYCPTFAPVDADNPDTSHCRLTTLPVEKILERLRNKGWGREHVLESADAGRFVCNYVYYTSLGLCEAAMAKVAGAATAEAKGMAAAPAVTAAEKGAVKGAEECREEEGQDACSSGSGSLGSGGSGSGENGGGGSGGEARAGGDRHCVFLHVPPFEAIPKKQQLAFLVDFLSAIAVSVAVSEDSATRSVSPVNGGGATLTAAAATSASAAAATSAAAAATAATATTSIAAADTSAAAATSTAADAADADADADASTSTADAAAATSADADAAISTAAAATSTAAASTSTAAAADANAATSAAPAATAAPAAAAAKKPSVTSPLATLVSSPLLPSVLASPKKRESSASETDPPAPRVSFAPMVEVGIASPIMSSIWDAAGSPGESPSPPPPASTRRVGTSGSRVGIRGGIRSGSRGGSRGGVVGGSGAEEEDSGYEQDDYCEEGKETPAENTRWRLIERGFDELDVDAAMATTGSDQIEVNMQLLLDIAPLLPRGVPSDPGTLHLRDFGSSGGGGSGSGESFGRGRGTGGGGGSAGARGSNARGKGGVSTTGMGGVSPKWLGSVSPSGGGRALKSGGGFGMTPPTPPSRLLSGAGIADPSLAASSSAAAGAGAAAAGGGSNDAAKGKNGGLLGKLRRHKRAPSTASETTEDGGGEYCRQTTGNLRTHSPSPVRTNTGPAAGVGTRRGRSEIIAGWGTTLPSGPNLRLALLVRQDLGLGRGAVASQCSRAALAAARKAEGSGRADTLAVWRSEGESMVVLGAMDAGTLDAVLAVSDYFLRAKAIFFFRTAVLTTTRNR